MSDEESQDNLITLEKLDSDSADLWEQLPGYNDYISKNSSSLGAGQAGWSTGLSALDVQMIQKLGAMSQAGICNELRKLYDLAYRLGVQEAKEMTRGKYLNVFGTNANRRNK